MQALNVLPPRDYIGAVESIPSVVQWIGRLRDAGAVYDVDGDLYFITASASGFGEVSGLDGAAMREIFAERGGDPGRPGKRSPLDCMLWQAARPDEPAWDTRLGHGRPGWHIECTAIALDHLGMGFDVQGGGSDLAFPHHEMCSAQAQVATGEPAFASHFVHAGMVGYEGHKMSKSRGNLVFVSRLRRAGVSAAVIRLALLAHHYRSDWEWSPADLERAEHRALSLRSAVRAPAGPAFDQLAAGVRARLADDLDAPGALSLLDDWATVANEGSGGDERSPEQVRVLLDTLLGVDLS
jgi:L-cysteine:1D-myo-inositol 2-amino-2-deoxy-alpha-D-glucopyranoside ligase